MKEIINPDWREDFIGQVQIEVKNLGIDSGNRDSYKPLGKQTQ